MNERRDYCDQCGAPLSQSACRACDLPQPEGSAYVIPFPGRIAAMRRHPSCRGRLWVRKLG